MEFPRHLWCLRGNRNDLIALYITHKIFQILRGPMLIKSTCCRSLGTFVPAVRKFVVIYLYVEMDLLRHLGSLALLTGALPFAFRLRLNQLFRWFKSQNDFNNKNTPFGAFLLLNWLREMDLNQRPSGYEPDELPDCSIPR